MKMQRKTKGQIFVYTSSAVYNLKKHEEICNALDLFLEVLDQLIHQSIILPYRYL